MFIAAALLAIGGLVAGGCSEPAPVQQPAESEDSGDSPEDGESQGDEDASDEADVERDPELAAELEQLIAEELPPISLRLSDDIPADCGVQASGCYVEGDAIYIGSDLDDFRRPEMLAHEFLHHVWDRDGLESDAALTDALNRAFDDEEGLAALVPPWQEGYVEPDGSILPTELFSYACTGLRSDQLDDVISDLCEQYLQVDNLPINQEVSIDELNAAADGIRAEAGLEPLIQNPYGAAASEARVETFTPYFQVPLSEYPESISRHLDAGCVPVKHGVRLTRPSDPRQIMEAFDSLLDGAISSSEYTGIGIATQEYDYIDARELFGDQVLRVNATLIVASVCA